jgi:tRNA threonylcarbamoyladenosine biosynthesis protein TsaB
VIVAFSTSSPQASVFLWERDGSDSWLKAEIAPQAASGACIRMLSEGLAYMGRELKDAELFLADLGPGSFTGTRVGVTLAKTLAYAVGAKVGGASAFDLVEREMTVVLPSKRDEHFVRDPGGEPYRSRELPRTPYDGYYYGLGESERTYPVASEFQYFLDGIVPMEPERLVPAYLVEPAISAPKKPYGADVAR